MNQEQAVIKAIEEMGDQTAGSVLQHRAEYYYGNDITPQAVYSARTNWRRKNNVVRDCRTYKGQARRNMMNDKLVELPLLKKVRELSAKHDKPALFLQFVGELLSLAHSKEHLLNAIGELNALQMKVAA